MKKISILFVLICFAQGGWFWSCSDENINDDRYGFVQPHIIYSDSGKVAQFVNDLYQYLPTGWHRLGSTSMLASATDEAVHSVPNSEAQRWAEGSWNKNYLRDNTFENNYIGIRKTFIFENHILPYVQDIVCRPATRATFLAQAKFIRAYCNFELLKRFGGYPVVDHELSLDEDLNIPRSNYDACVNYIVGMLNEAAKDLPLTWVSGTNYGSFGRTTKGAALALKARVLLYAASPLFNDPAKANDGLEHGAYNLAKWEEAAEAAAAVINLKNGETPVYDLFTVARSVTIGGVSQTITAYSNFFNTLTNNSEIILSRMEGNGTGLEANNAPVSYTGARGYTNPTWELASAYEMIDGTPFNWNNPAHRENPFDNREPRFASTINHNGSIWHVGYTVETFEGGKDNDPNNTNNTRTSFYLRKFQQIYNNWPSTEVASHCFPLLRYAEVLLNYAEAMNEAYGPDNDPEGYGMTARQAIELIRIRAGFTGNQDLTATVPIGNQNLMRDAIRHERRIELAFEEHRHLDVRRWKIAETVFNQNVSGLRIVRNRDAYTYTVVPNVNTRVFDAGKMYLYPFPQSEMARNKNLIQNTGWE